MNRLWGRGISEFGTVGKCINTKFDQNKKLFERKGVDSENSNMQQYKICWQQGTVWGGGFRELKTWEKCDNTRSKKRKFSGG